MQIDTGPMRVLLDAHLRVCVEDFDPLGGDEQIHLGEGLRFSVGTLLQDKNTRRTSCHWLPNETLRFKVSMVVESVCLIVLVQLKFMHVVVAVQGPALL